MPKGYAKFAGRETTLDSTVPVACMEGYILEGDGHITCLQDESWSHNSHCEPIG